MEELLKKEIEKNKDEIISKICDLIKISSISEESKAEKNMPFGKECNEALEYMLELGKKLGFKTKNIDGYCGYIEFGEGKDIVGIVSHLDVVPADESDWKITRPFEPKIINNKIYGRGAIDDKGPTIAALYAMKAIKDNFKVTKRIRLILGLNEEKSWKCINYYKLHEEIPNIGFSPDADFPCIYAEKGILNIFIEMPYSREIDKIIIENVDCKNNALNVVPKYCECKLKITNIPIKEFQKNIENIIKVNHFNIQIEIQKNNYVKLISKGIASHTAHPELGKNAIVQLLKLLFEIYYKYQMKNDLIEFFNKYIDLDYNGNKLEINMPDESGSLTLNLGRLYINPNTNSLKMGINLRIPINTPIDFVKNKFLEKTSEFKELKTTFSGEIEHLFIPKESNLIKTLTSIFNKESSQNIEPIAIGGATFARAFPNCVSFGANMPNEEDLCHKSDENIDIKNLMKATRIYANAIYELQNLKL